MVDKEKLQATEAEIDERIGAPRRRHGTSPRATSTPQLRSRDRLRRLERSITEDKDV